MNTTKKSSSIGFIAGMLLSLFTGHAAAALDIAQEPLSLADQVASNVMVMLDNSGSMTDKMYKDDFDATKSYSGMFTDGETYEYDPDIPVNTAAYTYMKDASGGTVIDDTATGAFVEKTCTPGAGANCWSGKFLNWLTTRRIDASRDVLVGGKLESRTASNYNHPSRTDLNNTYKKVANNEPSDRDETDSSNISYNHSPIPNDLTVTITSPAKGGNFKSKYDPYAKLFTLNNTPIYDKNGVNIGEFNTTPIKESWTTIKLNKTYTEPVVIATAPSYADSDPVVVRIRNVTTTQFQIKLKRYKYDTGSHDDETISFIVVEKGEYDLLGDKKLKAGTVTNFDEEYVTSGCTNRTNSRDVSFASAFPATFTPVVISSSMTENGSDPITTRVWNISASGFKLAIQEEENQQNHADETIGYIAIEPGTVDDTTNAFKLEAGLQSNVDDSADTINYTTSFFTTTPAFLGAMQTINSGDTAALRLDSNSSSTATLHVEEEQSCDSEVAHANEDVGYVALEGPATSYNLALVVKGDPITGAAPTGVLHDVKDDVRMGISFYRYDPNAANIYESSVIQGGTLRFNIPKNPFVKKPSETDTSLLPGTQQGYRLLEGYVGKPIETIVDAVERYPSIWGTTPLAENLWEVIKYYEQSAPYYDTADPLPTPFADFIPAKDTPADPFYIPAYGKTLSCVNSNVLIVTDGEPFKDAGVPTEVVDYDGDSATDEVSDLVNKGTQGKGNLDDVAYWAYCDRGPSKTESCAYGAPTRDLRTDTGMDGDQYLKIDTIGFAGDTIRPILQDTADNAGGKAYAASGGDELKTALKAAFDNATPKGSASAVSANSTQLSGDSLIYVAGYDSADWSGQLQAYGLDTDGSPELTPDWTTDSAGTFAAPGTRKVFTYKPPATVTAIPGGTGIEFKVYGDLNAAQQAALGADQTEATARINYIRGDQSNELTGNDPETGIYRKRTRIMGDIANSNPWFVGRNSYGYSTLTGDSGQEGAKYRAFVVGNLSRKDTLYVGANDGMLHAFDATTGVEKFAYVPATVIPSLSKLTDPEYGNSIPHQYFVDGSPRSADVYYNGNWHTILVGTTGAGGRGLFALDVTDPDSFDASKVLFEFNDTNDTDMGAAIPEPTIARMANGKWSIIMGNGYNSGSGTAKLYIIDIEGVINGTAGSITKIDTSADSDNGLGSPAPVDLDGDRTVDVIYAGDLKGKMWKFDVSDSVKGEWKSAFIDGSSIPQPLFTATDDATSTGQAITAKPQVGRHPDDGVMVYFGTGKFFENSDDNVTGTPQVQTFYGLRDNFPNGDSQPITGRGQLQQQTIISEQNAASFDVDTDDDGIADDTETNDIRITSDNAVDYSTKKGWYMDLQAPSAGGKGERVISQAVLTGGRILFATLAPSEDPCEFGGSGWFMLLDAVTGKRLDEATFDFNNDGLFTSDDYGSYGGSDVPGSGKRSDGTGKLSATVEGNKAISIFTQKCEGDECKPDDDIIPPGSGGGRQSWRQLR